MNYDECFNNKSLFRNFIHETNHGISYSNFIKLNEKDLLNIRGPALDTYTINADNFIKINRKKELNFIEEYCNEQQSKAILGMYTDRYGLPDFPETVEVMHMKNNFETWYDNYTFLLNDFYNMFAPELARAKVDNRMLYYNIRGEDGIDENYTMANEGIIDYESAVELGRIVRDFDAFMSERCLSKYFLQKESIDVDSMEISKYQKFEINRFIKRKNKVMEKIRLDYDKYIASLTPEEKDKRIDWIIMDRKNRQLGIEAEREKDK